MKMEGKDLSGFEPEADKRERLEAIDAMHTANTEAILELIAVGLSDKGKQKTKKAIGMGAGKDIVKTSLAPRSKTRKAASKPTPKKKGRSKKTLFRRISEYKIPY